MKNIIYFTILASFGFAQVEYNHPELNWQTFETEHFQIHLHDDTEMTAREAATVAEHIYPNITGFYEFKPKYEDLIPIKGQPTNTHRCVGWVSPKLVC